MEPLLLLEQANSKIAKLEAQLLIWQHKWSFDTQVSKYEMSQIESDIVWFAKGHFEVGIDWQGKGKPVEGSDVEAFYTMCDTYKYADPMSILTELAGIAILDTTYPQREFRDFMRYWLILSRKKGDPDEVTTEAMLSILAKWQMDERFVLRAPSWKPDMFKKKGRKEE